MASRSTLSWLFSCINSDTLKHFNDIIRELRKVIYFIKRPDHMLFYIDSTLFDSYGKQERKGCNYHYQVHGCSPLPC
ncbi:MAG: transposase [Hungatella sp.]|nr:transposase [Hungatella sp.]